MMKKHYLLGLALAATFAVKSQTVIDFESTVLAADTFNNGADLSGGFTYGDVHFSNYYDATYNYNTGFSISNMTDVTTAGYTNQYSAITGAGNNSSNYATFYPSGEIDLSADPSKFILSADITNTTYAYLSMLNGDFVGKKFGDTVNAAGVSDSTNGEDYFILTIYGRTATGDTTGQVDVVLADYRFADDVDDFIVDSWMNVDLQALNSAVGVVEYISFGFASSDIGQWGINTPTYFAIDNFTYSDGVFGLDELNADLSVYPNPIQDVLNIEGVVGDVVVTDGTGKLVFVGAVNGSTSIHTSLWNAGVYFITVSNDQGKLTQKVIK